MKDILAFLTELSCNNNREWFNEHKDWYVHCQKQFEQFTAQWLERLVEIDPEMKTLTPKDCIWRIYRDVRFSHNKKPYKEWFGVFVASGVPGQIKTYGKKSMRGGYYVHVQPGQCMFGGGIWDPGPELLKALRKEIEVNGDELEQIMSHPAWKRYFGDFDAEYMLKRVPSGFEPDSRYANWLKRKAYTFSHRIKDEEMSSPELMDMLVDMAVAAKPVNDFLNYTFELYGEFPSYCR
jgi:uncharacterized protein (TIGR02453 family)